MSEPINNGELLLPVCIPESEITDILSALDLYRVLRKSGKSYAAFDAVVNALDFLDNPQDSPCLDIELGTGSNVGCYRMDTSTEIFSFYPNDPFDPDDDNETSVGAKWIRFGDITELENKPEWVQIAVDVLGEYIGYFDNDCLIQYQIDPLSVVPSPSEFWDYISNLQNNISPFPNVLIEIEGQGQADLEFPIFPLGGRCLIFKDTEFSLQTVLDVINGSFGDNSVQVIELERDLLSSTPELIPTTVAEIEFDEDGQHTILCVFVPSIEPDQAPFIFPFGGIREIEFCGNLKVIGSQTNTVYDRNNYRLRQATRQGVIPMGTTEDFYAALERYETEKANRWLLSARKSNVLAGIEIDKDTGETIVKTVGGTLGRQDITITSEESRAGGVYRIAVGVRDLLAEANAQRTGGLSASTVLNLSKVVINPLDVLTWGTLVNDYYTNSPDIVIDADLLAEAMFCKGQSVGFAQYIGTNHNESDIDYLSQFWEQIPTAKINEWYSEGSQTPSSAYLNYECALKPDVEFEYTPANYSARFALVTPIAWNFSQERRVQVIVTGNFKSIADNDITNDIWYETDAQGMETLAAGDFRLRMSGNNVDLRQVTPAHSPDGSYSFTAVIPAYNYTGIEITNQRGTPYISDPDGLISVVIKDLGSTG